MAAAGSVVGAPSASMAQPAGIASPRCRARYTLPRATAVLAMSMTMTSCSPAGAAIDHGLVPTVLRLPAPGGHGRAGVGGEDGHAAVAGGHAGEVGGGAEVVGVAHGHDADAVAVGAAGGLPGGVRGQHLADAVVAVDHGQRPGVGDGLGGGHGPHDPGPDAVDVPAEPHDPVGLVAPEVGGDQAVGDQSGIGVRHADGGQHGGGELGQPRRGDPVGGLRAVVVHRRSSFRQGGARVGVAEPLTHQVRRLVNSVCRRRPARVRSRCA